MKLTAIFALPLALCIWQSLNTGTAGVDVAAPHFWLAAAQILATQASWSTLGLLDPKVMEDFVGLAPTCCVPDSFTVTASVILPPQWLSVSAAARPILLLVQGVLLMSHFHQPGVLKEGSDLEVCKQTGAQVFCANLDNMRLQQADAVAPDNTASAAAEVSRHVHSLRSVLLLLKVAGLLLSSKLRSSALEKATDAVWSAAVGASIQVSDNAMLPVKLADTSHEQYSLLLHLIQMLRPLMRQTAKDKTSYGPLRLCWACCCLKWLLPSSLPRLLQAVAPNIISGKVYL